MQHSDKLRAMQYNHISIEEREKIQQMIWNGLSLRQIAKTLNRNTSSISRELARNGSQERKLYHPRIAQKRAEDYRRHRGRELRLKDPIIREYVLAKLKLNWSPEQISGRISIDLPGKSISHEAIYQYIYAQIHRDGCGYTKPGRVDLRMYLRRKRKIRMRKFARKCQRVIPKGKSISERPDVVNTRERCGDWEGDTVESRDHKPGINTLVERKIGYVLITKLQGKNSQSTVEAVSKRLSMFPDRLKYTLTLDNGPENSDWKSMEEKAKIACYYANPYHSWERGSNENTNGLIREYFPKKTDFTTIRQEEIDQVQYLINTRPRKRLGYKTPLELMSVALLG